MRYTRVSVTYSADTVGMIYADWPRLIKAEHDSRKEIIIVYSIHSHI